MQIPKVERRPFIPCPAGPTGAVMVDNVEHMGVVTNFIHKETGKPVVRDEVEFVFQTSRLMDDGRRFIVTQRFNATLNGTRGKESKLYLFLKSWAIDPSRIEVEDSEGKVHYDFDLLLGEPALISVVHNKGKKEGMVFCDIGSIMPLPEGMPSLVAEGYTRRKDRETEQAPPAADEDVPFPSDVDEIPF